MKKLNVFRLGLLFAGCFLGAGYVSGQELRQYFVVYGAKGYLGLLAAVAILYIFGVLCLRMAQRTGLTGADELVVPWRAPWLHALVMVLESLFLFALVTIMCAGVGALLEQIFAIPHWLGSLLFAALVLACRWRACRAWCRHFPSRCRCSCWRRSPSAQRRLSGTADSRLCPPQRRAETPCLAAGSRAR